MPAALASTPMVIEHCFLDMRLDSVADYGSNLIAVTHAMKGTTVMSESKSGRGSLFAGGVAAILASACCLGPLVLITLGISGAWIGNLAALEPFRPWFIGAALVGNDFCLASDIPACGGLPARHDLLGLPNHRQSCSQPGRGSERCRCPL